MSDNAEDDVTEEATEDDTTEGAVEDTETEEAEESEETEAAEETEETEEAEETEETEDAEETTEGFEEGDFVELEYTARTVEEGTLVDTTDQEVAEEEGVAEDQEFGARTIVLGQGHLFGPVGDDIIGKAVGDSGSVVVSAVDAFGEYDEDEVRTISADKLPEDDRYPGAHVEVEGQHGTVKTIIGGRARVDFNHPLAGEDIEYEYEIVGEVEDRVERAEGLLEMMLDVSLDVWFETDTVEEERLVEPDEDEEESADDGGEEEEESAGEDEASEDDDEEDVEYETEMHEVDKETLYIEAVPELTMNQQWMMGKQQLAQQLIDLLDVDRVIVQETLVGTGGMTMPGMGGASGLEEMLEEADVDAEEIMDEIETPEL